MTENYGGRYSYLLRGLVVMMALVALYSLVEDPSAVFTVVFAVLFVVGAIMAVGSPTRWSARTTLRLYQAFPLLFGVGTVATGGYFLVTIDVPVLASTLIVWGILSLIGLIRAPWDEVEAYLERLNAPETEINGAVAPLPKRPFLRFKYAAHGVLTVSAAVILAWLIVDPDLGHIAILAGVGGAGLVHILCSPYSGPPERVVRLRQARWVVLGAGTAASSLYGALVVDATLPAVFWGVVTLGIVYWAVVRTSWDEVREGVADAQSETDATGD